MKLSDIQYWPYRIKERWYQFKCLAWHRYTTVKPRTLPHTWTDRCDLLPHVMFEILSDFAENECGADCWVEWYGEHGQRVTVNGEEKYFRDELQDLSDWWSGSYLKNYPKRRAELWDMIRKDSPERKSEELDNGCWSWEPIFRDDKHKAEHWARIDAVYELEKRHQAELKSRCKRLIDIMEYMWT